MKKLSVVAAALTVLLALSVVGCGQPSSEHTGGQTNVMVDAPEEYIAQVGYARDTYDGVYESISREAAASVLTSAAGRETSEEPPTLSAVKTLIDKYTIKDEPNSSFDGLERSYVGDIFTYSQLQYAIMDEYGAGALVGGFSATYDWSEMHSPQWSENADVYSVLSFQSYAAPDTASFPGAVENRTYIKQRHYNSTVTANLEYYCDETTGEIGVTTINYHESGIYEYHYCDAATHFILTANGRHENGKVTINSFRVNVPNVVIYDFTDEEKAFIFDYAESERVRIESRIEELDESNAAIAEREGIEIPNEPRPVAVSPDISALASLLGQ